MSKRVMSVIFTSVIHTLPTAATIAGPSRFSCRDSLSRASLVRFCYIGFHRALNGLRMQFSDDFVRKPSAWDAPFAVP